MFCWCFSRHRGIHAALLLPIAKSASIFSYNVKRFIFVVLFFLFRFAYFCSTFCGRFDSITIAFISLIFPFSQHSLLRHCLAKCSQDALTHTVLSKLQLELHTDLMDKMDLLMKTERHKKYTLNHI